MTHETLADQVIRLWPDGPPSTLEGVGLEIEFRGPYGAAADSAMLRNVSEPTLSAPRRFTSSGAASTGYGLVKQGAPSDRWIDLFRDWLADLGFA
jgi:hypothetical protein